MKLTEYMRNTHLNWQIPMIEKRKSGQMQQIREPRDIRISKPVQMSRAA